jgi:hypothetical protein
MPQSRGREALGVSAAAATLEAVIHVANRLRTAETPHLAAQGQSVSRKAIAEVPLTALSFGKRQMINRLSTEF